MTHFTTTLAVGAVCAILSSTSFAQVDRDRQPGKQEPIADHDYRNMATLDDLIGAKVKLGIAPDGNDSVKRLDGKSDTAKEGKVKEGEIEDVIVDLRNGHCAWAIIGVGGILGIGEKDVAVPCNVLHREVRADEKAGDKPTFILSATEEDLQKLAKFKKSEAEPKHKGGIETALREAEASWATLNRMRDVGEAKPATIKPDEDPPARVESPSLMLGSCLDDHKLLAASKEFGSVNKCIVECSAAEPAGKTTNTQPKVRYFVISRGGVAGIGDTLYLVPLSACTLVKQGDDWAWSVNRTVEQIESGGVRYKKPDNAVLDRNMSKQADEFFKTDKSGNGNNYIPR